MKLSVYLLEMKWLYFTFLIVSAPCFASSLTGVFDAGWSTWYLSQDSLSQMHQELNQAGMEQIVLQYAVVEGSHRYYPSNLWFAQDEPDHSEQLPKTLIAASLAQNKVWLGLYYNDHNWWNPPSVFELEELRDRNLEVLNELHQMYGNQDPIVGVYLPQELARYYWQSQSEQQLLVETFLKPVTDSAKALGYRVMSAPFYNSALESDIEFAAFLQGLFNAGWSPDVIAVQDGIGVDHVSFSDLPGFLNQTKNAVTGISAEFWVDVELFAGNVLADTTRIRQQIEIAWSSGATGVVGYDLSVLGGDGILKLRAMGETTLPTPLTILDAVPAFDANWEIVFDRQSQRFKIYQLSTKNETKIQFDLSGRR
jgi:hypothetical protein